MSPTTLYNVVFNETGRTTGTTATYLAGYESSFQSELYPCKVYKAMFFHEVFAYPGDSGAPAYEKLGGHAILLGYIVANTDVMNRVNATNEYLLVAGRHGLSRTLSLV